LSQARLEAFLAESRERVDAYLERLLPASDAPPRDLHEGMRYAVFPGGKRLRPALSFATAVACGAVPEQVLPVAAAAELLHAYSLVHDDLPSIDDDAERRGRPTAHLRFGEGLAVLIGDALQAEAFGSLARSGAPAEVVAALATAAGSRGLVGGQADDLARRPDPVRQPDLGHGISPITSIHARKTSALFVFSVVASARLAGASGSERGALEGFARHYGLAFQLLDDLLDAGSDGCSALEVLSPDAIRARAAEQAEQALAALERFGDKGRLLRALGEQLQARLP
jgi:geranylgeranyl pyrophosphate synthase